MIIKKHLNQFKMFALTFLVYSVFLCFSVNHPVQANQNISSTNGVYEVVAMFETGVLPSEVDTLLSDDCVTKITSIPEVGIIKVQVKSEKDLTTIKNYLKSIDKQLSIFQDTKISPVEIQQTDLLSPVKLSQIKNSQEENAVYFDQWGWDVKQVTNNGSSFTQTKGSHQTVVAVIDSGIDHNHPALKNNIISNGKSFVPGVTDTIDRLGHGTMVAGSIAANGKLLGIGPDLGIVPYKVFEKGSADSTWVIQAIIQAAKDHSDVINLSLGTYIDLKNKEDREIIKAYQKAVQFANRQGAVVVASSGTDGYNMNNPVKLGDELVDNLDLAIHLPGGLPGVITVGATNNRDSVTSYSNYGHLVDISAPAGDYGPEWESAGKADINSFVLTTYPTNLPQTPISAYFGLERGYEFMIGTSLASPKVAAVAGLIIDKAKAENIDLEPSQVRSLLLKGATLFSDTSDRKKGGVGIVNAERSLTELLK